MVAWTATITRSTRSRVVKNSQTRLSGCRDTIAGMMVAIALAALMIGLFAWIRTDISRMGDRLDKRIDGLEKRLVDGLDGLLRAVEHGLAKLEGLLEGLREAIAGRKDVA